MYRAREFAQLAGTTVKALHHYDRSGLLKPRRSRAGYRMYREQDLTRLEQIVALKFLGLPLKQIKLLLDRDTLQLPEALRMQRRVLEEKRRLLDRAIEVIVRAEGMIQTGEAPGAAILKEIIGAIEMQAEMQNDIEFMKNYHREEVWTSFKTCHHDWPSRDWNELFHDVARALADDAGSLKSQSLAARWQALLVADSDGDAKNPPWADKGIGRSAVLAPTQRRAAIDILSVRPLPSIPRHI
ncbi:MAG TPA: MerR family transcriptional regulator [Bryobacteraceae bacterium]|nr:MerR family transcriptional regulator [Bryobacteraceae bacterium]